MPDMSSSCSFRQTDKIIEHLRLVRGSPSFCINQGGEGGGAGPEFSPLRETWEGVRQKGKEDPSEHVVFLGSRTCKAQRVKAAWICFPAK